MMHDSFIYRNGLIVSIIDETGDKLALINCSQRENMAKDFHTSHLSVHKLGKFIVTQLGFNFNRTDGACDAGEKMIFNSFISGNLMLHESKSIVDSVCCTAKTALTASSWVYGKKTLRRLARMKEL